MDKANLIISIIIVLCIATAVAAYGLINNDNAVFSDLASMDSGSGDDTGDGIGNNTTLENGTSSSLTGSSSSGSGSSSVSSGSGSGSSGSGSGSSKKTTSSPTKRQPSSPSSNQQMISQSKAESIALSAAPDSSYKVTSSYRSNGVWYVNLGNGTQYYGFEVEINAYTGKIIGGGGGGTG